MDFIIETNVPYAKGGAKPDIQVFFGSSSAHNYKDLQSENPKKPQTQQRILLQNGSCFQYFAVYVCNRYFRLICACLCCIHFIVCVYGKFADILLSYMPEIKDIIVQYKGRTLVYGSEYIIEN